MLRFFTNTIAASVIMAAIATPAGAQTFQGGAQFPTLFGTAAAAAQGNRHGGSAAVQVPTIFGPAAGAATVDRNGGSAAGRVPTPMGPITGGATLSWPRRGLRF